MPINSKEFLLIDSLVEMQLDVIFSVFPSEGGNTDEQATNTHF